MKRLSAITVALLLCGIAIAYTQRASAQANAGWITLFDGKSLNGWSPIGDANWRVEDGAIVTDKGKGYLVSKDAYTDYEIRAEFWVSDDANSGVFIRCSDPTKINAENAYEVNIFDQRPDPTYGTGAIVNVAKVVPMPKAGGKWNDYDIVARGPRFTITLDGKRTVNGAVDYKHASGWIALQYTKGVVEGGVVKFRKVEIKTL